MPKLATTQHPYYPSDWLSKEQAIAMLKEHGFTPNVTLRWCKANRIAVSGTGHISQLALQQYIERRCFRIQQEAQDMGQPIAVLMEDEPVHTAQNGYRCSDPDCPCAE